MFPKRDASHDEISLFVATVRENHPELARAIDDRLLNGQEGVNGLCGNLTSDQIGHLKPILECYARNRRIEEIFQERISAQIIGTPLEVSVSKLGPYVGKTLEYLMGLEGLPTAQVVSKTLKAAGKCPENLRPYFEQVAGYLVGRIYPNP